jgi:hypothetical protein
MRLVYTLHAVGQDVLNDNCMDSLETSFATLGTSGAQTCTVTLHHTRATLPRYAWHDDGRATVTWKPPAHIPTKTQGHTSQH